MNPDDSVPAEASVGSGSPARWRRPSRSTPLRRHRTRVAYAFLAPSFLVFLVFTVYPNLEGIRVSLFDYNPFRETFIGFGNYVELAGDPRFWNALRNTVVYASVTMMVTLVLALALALLLNSRIAFRGFTRSVVFVPFVLSLGVVSIAFTFLLDPDIGWLSYIMRGIGFPPVAVLRDPLWAMATVIAVGVWKSVGYFTVIFLAGLQQVPRELYEAAAVDGVGPWQRFWNVTLPLLSNTTMLVTILLLIGGLSVFDQVHVMTAGGPYYSTESLVGYIFNRGFGELRMGYASAIAVVFTVIVMTLSLIQIRFFNRRSVQF